LGHYSGPGNRYDVIVIGGGPAGAMTGYHLAKAGIRVLVLEAKQFPRQKPCGGGLQRRAMASIPFDIAPIVRGTIHRVSVSYGLGVPCQRAYAEPLVHTILRPEFDEFLLHQAERSGAAICQGVRCRGLELTPDGFVRIDSGAGPFLARCVVGADGANSVVRTLLNPRDRYFWQAALFCEVPRELLNAHALDMESIRVDWGTLPSGYAWAFPKRDYVNFGAGAPISVARHLKAYVSQFLRASDMVCEQASRRLNFVGHQLPTLTPEAQIANRRVLLVGDAAGFIEPFTGDGISFACQSAEMAARCISRSLSSSHVDLRSYTAAVRAELMDELGWSRKLLSLSAAFPSRIYRIFKENDVVWHTFCKVLRGEDSFRHLKKEILGPFAFASRAIDWLAERLERRTIRGAIVHPMAGLSGR
jgi:geranylgeranyl reductase family protein